MCGFGFVRVKGVPRSVFGDVLLHTFSEIALLDSLLAEINANPQILSQSGIGCRVFFSLA